MIYTVMKNHWTHACGSQLKLIPDDQECEQCGINQEVESVRYAGFTPYWPFTDAVAESRAVKVKKRKGSLFAMLLMKKKKKAG